jgi:hypothetical protein
MGSERGQPHDDVGHDRSEMLLEHVFDAVATGRRMEEGDSERGRAAPQCLEQGEIVQRRPGLSPTAAGREPECTQRGRAGTGAPTSRSNTPLSTTLPRPREWPHGRSSAAAIPPRTGESGSPGSRRGGERRSERGTRLTSSSRRRGAPGRRVPGRRAGRRERRSAGSPTSPVVTIWRKSARTRHDRTSSIE